MRTLVWFRGKDLRLADHAPLSDALARGEIVPLFVLDRRPRGGPLALSCRGRKLPRTP